MVFLGVGSGDPAEPGLHHPAFLPPDAAVGQVTGAMLTAYLAAAGA